MGLMELHAASKNNELKCSFCVLKYDVTGNFALLYCKYVLIFFFMQMCNACFLKLSV